ncbi:MAG: hypothetical protein ABSG88_09155 [Bradyrhizobium sp.]
MPQFLLPQITDIGTYNKNTKEQYEAIGRFVASFEAMVGETRDCIADLLVGESPNTHLVQIALHHSALTAKPLFEIFRTLMVEYLRLPGVTDSELERNSFNGVLAVIAGEYMKLANIRNTLLHGTWFIGYPDSEDPNSENFLLHKLKPTKSGLEKEDVPKQAAEILELQERCEDTRTWIATLHFCVPRAHRPFESIKDRFVFANGHWRCQWTDAIPETLPRKSPSPPQQSDGG